MTGKREIDGCILIASDRWAGIVTVLGSKGHAITVTVGNSWPAIVDDDFDTSIIRSVDNQEPAIHKTLDIAIVVDKNM